jgi:hypothetical protein
MLTRRSRVLEVALELHLAHVHGNTGPRCLGGIHLGERLAAGAHVLGGVEELEHYRRFPESRRRASAAPWPARRAAALRPPRYERGDLPRARPSRSSYSQLVGRSGFISAVRDMDVAFYGSTAAEHPGDAGGARRPHDSGRSRPRNAWGAEEFATVPVREEPATPIDPDPGPTPSASPDPGAAKPMTPGD